MPDKDTTKPGVPEKDPSPKTPAPEDRTIIKSVDEGEEATPSKPQYQPPYMVVVEGPRTGARFPLGDGSNIIGRAPGNAIRLEDQSVSRQHSEIAKGPSGWVLKDLGSKNGTFINGKPVTEATVIGHKDIVKTGIYQLRLITQTTSQAEEMTLPPEMAMADRTVFVAAPPDSLTAEVHKKELPEREEPEAVSKKEVPEIPEVPEPAEEGKRKFPKLALDRRQMIMFGALGLLVIASVAYFGNRLLFAPKKTKVAKRPAVEQPQETPALPPAPEQPPMPTPPPVAAEQPQVPGAPLQPQMPGAPGMPGAAPLPGAPVMPGAPPAPGAQPLPGEAGQPQMPGAPAVPGQMAPGQQPPQPMQPAMPLPAPAQTIPVFLDFASSPLPAKISFQDKELGTTPLRVNVELEAGRAYTAQALFAMPEINQQYTQALEFTPAVGQSVVPLLFKGPIGMLKVTDLPRDVQFYLEGKYSYDKFQEQTAKLQEIVLQKPIYIPYGQYSLELRRAKQLGAASPTYVADIIFKRDFKISDDSPTFTLEVKDADLSVFPAKIKSDPPNADVFIDGKQVGKTPYEGNLPLGEHKLALRKEGYFEYTENLKNDINVPVLTDVKMKTSVAGGHLNNARLSMDRAMYQEAINELAEALNSQPAPTEVGLANYLLGVSYLKMNDVQRAMGYFEQAKATEAQRYPAMLGLANCYAMQQMMDKALPLLVEVLLRVTDDQTKREAHDLFQKISPFRSVIYVYSEPAGAKVIVNDKPVAQATPVILHDLPLGNYRIRIEKPGFLPTDLNLSLSVNEFNPVIVKLKPTPQ